MKIAEDHGYSFALMRGVIDVNDQQLERMVAKISLAAGRIDGDFAGLVVGALGLTFKAGARPRGQVGVCWRRSPLS